MLRLIVKNRTSFRTYDFTCDQLQENLEVNPVQPELIGIEVIFDLDNQFGIRVPRLLDMGERKIPAIKAVRAHTGMNLKTAKEFVESAPVDLPSLDPEKLMLLVRDLREAGATVG